MSATKSRTISLCQITLAPRLRASFPMQMVVLVRIPGCSSFAVFARCFSSSPLMVRSDSLGTIVKTAFTVCSRTTGARSENPVICYGQQKQQQSLARRAYHLWEDLIIDHLLRQMVDHAREVVKQADSNCSIWVGEEPHYDWGDSGIKLLVGKFTADFYDR